MSIRIKSTHPPSQGDFVDIEEDQYDPKIHTLYEPKSVKPEAEKEPKSKKK